MKMLTNFFSLFLDVKNVTLFIGSLVSAVWVGYKIFLTSRQWNFKRNFELKADLIKNIEDSKERDLKLKLLIIQMETGLKINQSEIEPFEKFKTIIASKFRNIKLNLLSQYVVFENGNFQLKISKIEHFFIGGILLLATITILIMSSFMLYFYHVKEYKFSVICFAIMFLTTSYFWLFNSYTLARQVLRKIKF